MTSVVSSCAFANSGAVVARIGLQQEYLAGRQLLALSETAAALASCRKVLDHARRIEGFEPCRNEMIFERPGPSCYSFEPFAALMEQSRGEVVMAGFGGSYCQSTLVDAFRRTHKGTYLSDASVSHAPDDMAASEVHRAASTIFGPCAGRPTSGSPSPRLAGSAMAIWAME
jgi:nicotinamidase-related amidase